MKKQILWACTCLALVVVWLPVASAQTKPAVKKELTPPEIIKEFTTRESELQEVWKEYAYKQESRLQVLGPAKIVSGEYYQVSEFVFNDAGKHTLSRLPATRSRAW